MLKSFGILSRLGGCLLVVLWTATATASDFKIHAQLVWGTDQKKPEGSKYTALDPKSQEKLFRLFKWQNYWVVNETVSPIGSDKPALVKLSEKCAIDLKDLGNGLAEIRLYELKAESEPTLVRVNQHSLEALKKGEYCILAGADKVVWEDAWFVIVTAAK